MPDVYQPRDDRIVRYKEFKKRAEKLSKMVKKGETQYSDTLIGVHNEVQRLEAINKAETDLAVFAYRYFSDQFNANNQAGNIIRNVSEDKPHESPEEIAPIHADMYSMLNDAATSGKGGNYCIASPRGHAKTQIAAVINAIHALVYRRKKYVLLLSETDSLSKKIVASIANQLKYNEKLREDFGVLLKVEKLQNRKDSDENFITSTGVLVEASSAGKSLRGKTHNGHRPDLIILDDVSSINNEATENLRTQLIEWFNAVVEPLGDESTDLFFVGTLVTQSGLLSHVLARKDFKKSFHKAIISHPSKRKLWNDYEEIYTTSDTLEPPKRFYAEHREEMEKGIKLAWPHRWTYRELLEIKINRGARAFASEYMNESLADDERIFSPDDYQYYRRPFEDNPDKIEYNGDYIRLRDLHIVGAWDVAMAGSKRSAENAFVTVGRDETTGRIYVLDVYATREPPSVFIREILNRMAEYRHDRVLVEGVGAYSEFHAQLQDAARVSGLISSRIELIKSHGRQSKESRIEQLEPVFANKTLILSERHPQLIEQLRGYGSRGNQLVDILDALAMATNNVKNKRKLSPMDKPPGF